MEFSPLRERKIARKDVERHLRNSKGAMIYEGSSEVQGLTQPDYALGLREDKPFDAKRRPMTKLSGKDR